MSDIGSDFAYAYHPFSQTAPNFSSIQDVYNITRGTFEEFKMEGYTAPTTAIPLSIEHKIPKDKNRDIFADITKKSNDPGPTTYAPDEKTTQSRFWTTANGKFKHSRRKTFTEETIEISSKLPGPGNYMPTPKGEPKKKTAVLGKFNKNKPQSFLCNFEALAEEVPGSDKYFQKPEERERAYSTREKKVPVFKYHSCKPVKVRRDEVGPGYLKDLEKNFDSKMLRNKTPDPAISKEKRVSYFQQRALSNKHVPGVGNYKETDRAYTNKIVIKKDRTAYIGKYKYTRFTEAVSKEKQWVPGPGSYNIIPYAKKEKK